MFSNWVFESLVSFGAVKDYAKTPHVGKGRTPKGNLSIQLANIQKLKDSTDNNFKLWGFIGYISLISNGVMGVKTENQVKEFASVVSPENPNGLIKAIKKAGKAGCEEYQKRFIAA